MATTHKMCNTSNTSHQNNSAVNNAFRSDNPDVQKRHGTETTTTTLAINQYSFNGKHVKTQADIPQFLPHDAHA